MSFLLLESPGSDFLCLKLGADAAINYRETDFAERIRDITGGRRVDIVLDMVGAPYKIRNLNCLSMNDRLIQIAVMHGSKVEGFDLLPVMMRLTITGSTMRPRPTEEKGRIALVLCEKVWPVLNVGRCRPVIYEVFPLAEASEAHRLMESNAHIGKIVLRVAD